MTYYLYYPDFTHKDEGQGYCMAWDLLTNTDDIVVQD